MGKSPVLLSFGHGYTAQVLARRLMAQGWQVIGTTRSEEKAAAIRATGAEAVIWPHIKCGPLLDLATHILVSAGPESGSDPTLMHCAGALGARADQFDWVGYLSTTGVYGDRGGDWVNETSECTPTTERGKWRLAAEREWLAYRRETGLPVQIFRLAGIYGPGRGPFAKLCAGTARRIVKPNRWQNPRPAAMPFTWRDDADVSSAGSIADVGSHSYDTLRWILGEDASEETRPVDAAFLDLRRLQITGQAHQSGPDDHTTSKTA